MNRHLIALVLASAPLVVAAQAMDSLFPSDIPLAPPQEDPFAKDPVPSGEAATATILPDERIMQAPLLQPARPQSSAPTADAPVTQAAASTEDKPEPTPPAKRSEEDIQSARVAEIERDIPTITKDDLAALNPVIPEAPNWLSTQQRLDVQFYVHKRALERESELAAIRADIAENEKRTRVALTEEEGSGDGNNRRPPMFGGIQTANIDPNNFDQLAALSLMQGQLPALSAPEPPPPPPPPPTVESISSDSAVVNYAGVRQTVSVGDTIGGKFRVERLDYSSVTVRDGNVRTTLTLSW